MSEQPGAEAAAPEAPATLEQVLRSVQALMASVGQLATTGQQTQVTVGHLESSVALTTNACNALVDKVGKIQTQVDGGAVVGKKKDEGVDPEDLLAYVPHFSASNKGPSPKRAPKKGGDGKPGGSG
eukprot:SAG31_NODE_2259_length_6068_cov_10.272240_4_plen_126_part_00